MSDQIKNGIEKVILAGIGALALTAEKSKEILDELIKKGELTVEQGKIINEELKHTVKKNFAEDKKTEASNLINNLDKLSASELEQLKLKLNELEKEKTETI